jgi:hypothetical protein
MLSLEKKKKTEMRKSRGMPGGQRRNSEGGGTAMAEDLVLKGDAGGQREKFGAEGRGTAMAEDLV